MRRGMLAAVTAAIALIAGGAMAPAATPGAAGASCSSGGGPELASDAAARGSAIPTPPNDQDCDMVDDSVDNCPPGYENDFKNQNADQRNTDGDQWGDKCDADDDNDGVLDDAPDNCRTVANPNQEDADGDGIGDACVTDTDGDGVIDPRDNCERHPNDDQRDTDADRIGDACDNDDDEDYRFDGADNCRLVHNQDQSDRDGDGIGTACDADERAEGSGAPGAGGGTGASQDRNPPALRLTVARRHAFGELAGSLIVGVRCSEACAVTAELRLGARQARRLRLARARTVARGSAQLAAAGRTYAFVRFFRRTRQRLWRARRVAVQLRVEALDRAGNRRTANRRLTLVR